MEIDDPLGFEKFEEVGFDEDAEGSENTVGVGELAFQGSGLVEVGDGVGVEEDFDGMLSGEWGICQSIEDGVGERAVAEEDDFFG